MIRGKQAVLFPRISAKRSMEGCVMMRVVRLWLWNWCYHDTHTHNLGFKHGIAWSRMYFTQLKTSDTKYYHVKIKTTTRKHQKCNMFPRLVFSHTSQPPCFPHDPRWAEAALRKGPGWHPLALRRSHLRPWAEVPKDFKWWVCHRYDTLWHIYLYRYLLCICIDIFVWWWILMYFVLFC